MPTGEHCWKKNSDAQWARTRDLWISSLARSPLSYIGRYVEWDLNFYCTLIYIATMQNRAVDKLHQACIFIKTENIQDLCKYSIGNVVKTVFIVSSTFRPQAFFKKMNLKIIVIFCHLYSLPNVSHVNAVFAVHCAVIHVVFLARCARTLLCCVPCMHRPAPCPL